MKLSPNFTVEELVYSPIAIKNNIVNYPNQEQIKSMEALCRNVLQPTRQRLGKPILVSSGYRCEALNAIVGGAPNSQHTKGEAVDIKCYDNKRLFDLIRSNCKFDQLIWEHGTSRAPKWVHVSYRADGKNRNEVLKATTDKGKTVYSKI